jgi:hypothetical protein
MSETASSQSKGRFNRGKLGSRASNSHLIRRTIALFTRYDCVLLVLAISTSDELQVRSRLRGQRIHMTMASKPPPYTISWSVSLKYHHTTLVHMRWSGHVLLLEQKQVKLAKEPFSSTI